MKAKTVVIGLLTDRIDILECQGVRVLSARRVPVKLDSNATEWAKSVRGAIATLTEAVTAMGLTGRSATVLYHSPTESADYVSLRVNGAAAREAALLGCGDKLGFPIEQAVTEAVVVGRDRAGSVAAGSTAGVVTQERQTHVVVAGERDDHATVVASLVSEAGLKFVSATPIDAAVMARLAGGALKSDSQHLAMLYIGERRSFFLIVNNGSLVFARPIGLGLEAMVTALTRPLRSFDGSTPVELDMESARTILHRHGFPKRDEIVHEKLGVTGGQIIPLLQPVLQRFVVELRQSLRFGLPEEERQSVSVQFTGPGSSIPGFAGIVSTELGLKVEMDQTYAGYDGVQVGAQGSELFDAMQDVGLLRKLSLPPRAIAQRVAAGRLRRWLWTGAAAAIALVIADSMRYHARLTDLRREAESQSARAGEMQAMEVAGRKLTDAISAMTTLSTVMEIELGASVDYRACITEITRLTPASVRLDNVKFQVADDGKTVGTISGCAFVDGSTERPTQLEAFIGSLRTSPLFDDVSLSNVHMAVVQERNAQTFEVSVVGVSAPNEVMVSAETSSGTQGGQP